MSESSPSPPAWKAELDAITGARHGGAAAALLPRLRALDVRFPDTPEILAQLGWTHAALSHHREAAGCYERALTGALPPHELSAALLGLGCAWRCLGEYAKAEQVLRQGQSQFPGQREFEVFLALTLHNLGRHTEAIQQLVETLVETADDIGIAAHARTLRFQTRHLDERPQ